MTTENDIVLIHFEDHPLSYARIESILPDSKPDWYHVELLMLQIPIQTVTWILRNAYINGDPFTMNGKNMRLELIEKPKKAAPPEEEAPKAPKPKGKVISLAAMKDRSG